MTGETEPSLTVAEYRRLPPGVRADFDTWLRREGLVGEKIIALRLLEGAVEADRYVRDEHGRLIVGDDEIRVERCVYPISTRPPKAAMP